jgi:F0F1-type ATP synthase membrane subunit b/b'
MEAAAVAQAEAQQQLADAERKRDEAEELRRTAEQNLKALKMVRWLVVSNARQQLPANGPEQSTIDPSETTRLSRVVVISLSRL